jgi:prepilin-type processing-associated H-X9-DG protein
VERSLRPYQETTGPYAFSYSINVCVTGYGSGERFAPFRGGPPCQLGRAVNASHKVLAVEEDSTLINDGAWWPRSFGLDQFGAQMCILSVRHDRPTEMSRWEDQGDGVGRTNVVFLDGHCELIDRAMAEGVVYADPYFRMP